MAEQPKVLLTDYAWPDLSIERHMFGNAGIELVVAEKSDEESLVAVAADASAILTCWAQVSARLIDAAPNCKTVARLGIGLDNIDVGHCTSKQIVVTNVPAYCIDEVAEHTLALLTALARNIAFFHYQTKGGKYDLASAPTMYRLAGRTLGIIGFGKIGRAVAVRAAALKMNVLAYNRSPIADSLSVEQLALDELLSRSDFVSLHLPLTDETVGMFDANAFQMMKPGSFLINTARGGLVNEQALLDALATEHLAGAALDVQQSEPPNLNDPLFKHEHVIVTPHAAFTSVESLEDLRRTAVKNVIAVLEGQVPAHVVNRV